MSLVIRLSILLSGLLMTAFQPPASIRLVPQPAPFTPKEFYFATVTDQRPERGAVARLVLLPGLRPQAVDLEGGAAPALEKFINRTFRPNKSLRPVAVRILQLKLTETAVGNRVTGQLALTLAFDLIGKDDDGSETSTRLTTYRGNASYTRPLNQINVIEPTLRESIVTGLNGLNSYMGRESGKNEKLAKNLQVVFTNDNDLRVPAGNDTVLYNPTRKLTWADFRAIPRPASRYAAEVFTSFAYEGRSTVKDGVIILNLTARAYMIKDQSWSRAESKNAYALNHEQRHFDITKIIVERFKRKIHPDSLTLSDYNSIIQYQFIESFREMHKLQEQYDKETNHSINQPEQERWNVWIDTELRSLGVK